MERKKAKVKIVAVLKEKDHFLALCACGLFSITLLASVIN